MDEASPSGRDGRALAPEGVDDLHAKQIAAITQTEPLARERQERREQDLQRIDGAERHIQRRRRALSIGFDGEPRRFFVDVLVDVARQRHDIAQRRFELAQVDLIPDRLKRPIDLGQQLRIGLVQRTGPWHFAVEVFGRERQAALVPRRHLGSSLLRRQ
jgi:hypothetical protein